jgi:hypothetical protein
MTTAVAMLVTINPNLVAIAVAEPADVITAARGAINER